MERLIRGKVAYVSVSDNTDTVIDILKVLFAHPRLRDVGEDN